MFAPLIRQEVCLDTRMQREHSEEEVMAERSYLNNAYRPHPSRQPDGDWYTGVNIKLKDKKRSVGFHLSKQKECFFVMKTPLKTAPLASALAKDH